jgi:hypothetical protein
MDDVSALDRDRVREEPIPIRHQSPPLLEHVAAAIAFLNGAADAVGEA